VNNKYVELSKGTIEISSDSTYTEKLENTWQACFSKRGEDCIPFF